MVTELVVLKESGEVSLDSVARGRCDTLSMHAGGLRDQKKKNRLQNFRGILHCYF